MNAKLHRIECGYDPVEDRILLRFFATDFTEFRVWLTRRYTKIFWEGLTKALESLGTKPEAQRREQEQVNQRFEQEQSSRNPEAAKYGHAVAKLPQGELPILVTHFQLAPNEQGQMVLSMHAQKGEGVFLSVDGPILHSLRKLLVEIMPKTSWELLFK